MELLLNLLFVLFLTKYEALRLDKHQWISQEEKYFSAAFRLVFLLGISGVDYIVFIANIIFMASIYDLFLNLFRKDISDLFHLGENSKWDIFWSKRKKTYIVFRYIAPIIGVGLYLIKYYDLF